MGRKRKTAPQRFDDAKRTCLTWNMTDVNSSNGEVTVVDGNVCTLNEEGEVEIEPTNQSAVLKESVLAEKKKAQVFIDECDFHLTIKQSALSRENTWGAKLGVLSLKCPASVQLDWIKTVLLTKNEEFYLYVNKDTGRHLLYFERKPDGPASCAKETRPLAYFHVTSDAPSSCFIGLRPKAFYLQLETLNPASHALW